jgi:hypothetical protein
MKGCLIVVGILAAICLVLGIVVAFKWKGWAASATTLVADKAIASSGLPADQQVRLKSEIRKLADDFASGRISTADLERMMRAVADGPIILSAAVLGARQKYIEPSDLTPAEKAAATRALQRYARSVFEKTLPVETMRTVLEPIAVWTEQKPGESAVVRNDGNATGGTMVSSGGRTIRFKESVTRAELDRFVTLARQAADGARVPDEPFEPDWALELKKAIAEARKGP